MGSEQLTSCLMPGERLIWWGPPRQGLMFTGRDVLLVPFSLMWGGFALFWETGVIADGAPFFFALWGVPFVLTGLYLIVGRFLVDAWLRRNTLYALTDRRVLIVRSGAYAKLTALNMDQLPAAEYKEGRNGRGTICFGASSMVGTFTSGVRGGYAIWTPSLDPTPQFIGIEDARNVFDRIQNLMSSRNAQLKPA